jgi:lipoate-protein ligase A
LLGRVVTYDEAVDALAAGMVEALGIELRRGELTDQERTWTAQLMAEKYQHDSWTMRA